MLWRDVLNLVSVSQTQSDTGAIVETQTQRQVFADKKSVMQSEFYQALQAGLNPEIVFVVRTAEYANELLLIHDNKTYYVIRTYSKNGEVVELVCSSRMI